MTDTRKVYTDAPSAIAQLSRCNSLESITNGIIHLSRPVGTKAWGAVDFLIHRCKGYTGWMFVARRK